VSNLLEDYGCRVQFSVFECRLKGNTLDELLDKLKPFAGSTDSIRIYQICEDCLKKVVMLGRAQMPEEPGFFLV